MKAIKDVLQHDTAAIITAKSNSSRCPGKNFRQFSGSKTLIDIKMSQLLSLFPAQHIYLITNDEAKADFLAKQYEVNVRYQDFDQNSVISFMDTLREIELPYILRAHATTPFLGTHDILNLIQCYFNHTSKNDSAFAAEKLQRHLCDEQGVPINYQLGEGYLPQQNLTPIYEVRSGLFFLPREVALKYKHHTGVQPCIYEVDKIKAIDISDEVDWKLTQMLLASHEFKQYVHWQD